MLSFSKYRPVSHFIAPHSWMNDPCGILYVPETKDYILCYQWNPGTSEGGNAAWGMARSRDLVTWQDCMPALRNGVDTGYDSKGVFSGSIVSQMLDGRRVLYLFYTSVSRTPIHWSKPYLPGCETQSVAISTDFGKSWHRHEQNPLMKDPPNKTATTGWRDPYVAEWASLSTLRGVTLATKYMILASGEKGRGPQLRLYESNDLLDWKPLSVIFQGIADSPIYPGSDLCFGRNFECASFFTLGSTDYLICGVEQHPSQTTRHASRYTLWMSGALNLQEGEPYFSVKAYGMLDHGIFYAPHIFRGSDNQVLLSGWADEDVNCISNDQGWQGLLTHPRELYEIKVPSQDSADGHNWHHDRTTKMMTSMGVRPAKEVRGLRARSKQHKLRSLPSIRSKNYEIEATFSKLCGDETIIFNVRQAPQDREVTRIIISLQNESITIDRSCSSLNNGNASPESGPFKLINSKSSDAASFENLHVRIFVDNSLIEVYANGRFTLSSRIYPSLESALGLSYTFTGHDGYLGDDQVDFACWEDLLNAWPDRKPITMDAMDGEMAERATHVRNLELHMQGVLA